MLKQVVRNSKGEIIRLNAREQAMATAIQNQMKLNALGYEIDITTLTTIIKRVTEQKFFHIAPADYLPVRVGNGAWSAQLTTYRSFQLGDDFEGGVLNTGNNDARLAMADAGVDSISVIVRNWAKAIGWTIMDLEQAAKSGNWDLVTAKEKARKTNWDLGIQKIAFLGARSDSSVLGLYTQAGITTNTLIIPQPLKSLSPTDLNQFCQSVYEAYRSNCQRTAVPTHFVMPESDYNGCAAMSSPQFPLKTIIEVITDMFKTMTGNSNFKVLPCAYGEASNFADGLLHYAMYNYDEESLRMDIPVDYTSTLANSLNGFNFQNAAYGQFTGVMAYRPREMLYFTCAPL